GAGTFDPGLRERASERAVTGREPSAAGGSEPDVRHDVVRDGFQALRGREVAEPQDELAAARVDERLRFLRDLFGGAHEVVPHVLDGIAATPQRTTRG